MTLSSRPLLSGSPVKVKITRITVSTTPAPTAVSHRTNDARTSLGAATGPTMLFLPLDGGLVRELIGAFPSWVTPPWFDYRDRTRDHRRRHRSEGGARMGREDDPCRTSQNVVWAKFAEYPFPEGW